MDKEKLYNDLLENILEVYNSYLFLLFDSNKLKNALIDRLYERKDEINNNSKEIIEEIFEEITLKKAKEDNLELINNYTKVYKTNDSIKEIINYLRSFYDFLTFIEVYDNEEIMFKVVKDNESINRLLKIIVNTIISNKKYRYIKNNPKLESLISIYCIINNIVLENLEEEKEVINNEYNIKSLYGKGGLDTERLYAIEIRRIPKLTYQEEIELGRRIKNGDKEALNKLVTHNLRLADSIANSYRNSGVALDDLRQSANEGLMKAAAKFDSDKGYKFSTYATWWIKQSINRMLDEESKMIRIPTHAEISRKKYSKLKEKLLTKLGHEPSYLEMQKEYDMDYDYIKLMESIENISHNLASLDEPIGEADDKDTSFIEMLEDKSITDFSDLDLFEGLFKDIKMTTREKDIIIRRHKYGETEEEIAIRYGVTRQRINQLEEKIYTRILNNPKKRKELDIYREQLGINQSYYIGDRDKLNDIAKKIINRLKNSNDLKLFKELDFTLTDKLYFILRYGFSLDNKDIYKYNIIANSYCSTVSKRIMDRLNNPYYKDMLLTYINNPMKIIGELNIDDIYNEYKLIIEDMFNRGSLEEQVEFRVNYYFTKEESRFIYILKKSNFNRSMIIYLIIKYVLVSDYKNNSINSKIEKNIKESSYKDEIIYYLNNKDLILEELKFNNYKKLVK